MSPREMMKSAGTFLDLKDSATEKYAYGKVWPVLIMCCIIFFHAIRNPFDLGTAILLSATAVGPWMLVKFLERTSVTISRSSTQADSRAVVSEKTVQKTGAIAEPGD